MRSKAIDSEARGEIWECCRLGIWTRFQFMGGRARMAAVLATNFRNFSWKSNLFATVFTPWFIFQSLCNQTMASWPHDKSSSVCWGGSHWTGPFFLGGVGLKRSNFPRVSEANMLEHSKLKTIKLGIFLPHEIASAFYHFRSGDLFFSLLTGTPDVAQLKLTIVWFAARCEKYLRRLGSVILYPIPVYITCLTWSFLEYCSPTCLQVQELCP